jgi:hypothetical protein
MQPPPWTNKLTSLPEASCRNVRRSLNIGMKTCTCCKRELPSAKFRQAAKHKDGLSYFCKECLASKARKWRQTGSFAVKQADRYSSLRKYGLTIEQYNTMLQRQGGVCAICKKSETMATTVTWSLSVDHDHKTKKCRGLLCTACNQLLGKAKENVEILRAAVTYLDSYR